MKLERRDVWATALIAAAVIAYLGYLAFGSVPFIEDARGMAAVGLVFGFASRRVTGPLRFRDEQPAFIGGLGATLAGIVAFATGSDLVLALFMMSTVGLWAASMFERRASGRHRVGARSRSGAIVTNPSTGSSLKTKPSRSASRSDSSTPGGSGW